VTRFRGAACTLFCLGAADVCAEGAPIFEIGVGTAWNSNLFFTPQDEVSTASAVADLVTGYSIERETSRYDLTADGHYQPYEDDALSPSSAVGIGLAMLKEREYGSSRFSVSYRNESSLIDAFDNDGRFVDDERLETLRAGMQHSFELGEANTLVIHTGVERVGYYDTPNDILRNDYDFTNGAMEWEHQAGERMTWGVGVVATRYTSEGDVVENEVVTYGPIVSLRREVDDTFRYSAEISLRKSDTDAELFGFIERNDGGTEYYGSLEMQKDLERGRWSLLLLRQVQPLSNARQQIRDQATVSFGYELSERSSLTVGLTALEDQSNNDSLDDARRAFASDVSYVRELSETMSLAVGYRYGLQESDPNAVEARANTVWLSLRRVTGHAG